MANFPSHYVNPQEKGEDWIHQMVTAIHNEWGSQSFKSFEKGARRYALNKLYSLGKQPIDIYKPSFELEEDRDSSYINLDFSPPAIIPKLKRITNNRFAKIDFNVNAEAIDPYALDERLDYESEERANIQVRSMLQELGIGSEVLDSGEVDQPKDEEELAIKMDFGYKHNQAIDIEKKIDAVFSHERISELLERVRDYGFDTGVFAIKVSTDPSTGKVILRVVNPANLIVSPTTDPYFRDIWYAGEVTLVTIDEIRKAATATGTTLNEDDLEELASQNAGSYGNPRYFSGSAIGSQVYDSYKVPVFDVEFLSCDRIWWEKRWDKRGNPVMGKVAKPKDKKDREYSAEDRSVVYRAKWAVGSKVVYDYGLKSDIPVRREQHNFEAMLSYKIIAPEMNNMETSPIIENLIPDVDQITIAWYKLQNVIAKARPKGIAIEIGALEDIALGDGGDGGMKPIDILDMFNQTGLLVYRKINFEGIASNYKPIEELNNGLGTEAQEYFAVIQNYIGLLKDKLGFNDVTDGTTPDPKTLNGVASMMAEATNNALHHLFSAEKSLIEQVADEVAIRVHDSIAFKKNSPYRNVMAPSVVKSIRENKDHLYRQFSVTIQYGSDQLEKQELAVSIEKALELGQITLADKYTVKRCRNIKQAEQILAYRIKKNLAQRAAEQENLAMLNAQASAEAARAAEEEKRKTIQMEAEFRLAEIAAKAQAEADNMILEYTLKANLIEGPARDGRITVANVNADAVKESARIKESIKFTETMAKEGWKQQELRLKGEIERDKIKAKPKQKAK
jgi:hypothetical protein